MDYKYYRPDPAWDPGNEWYRILRQLDREGSDATSGHDIFESSSNTNTLPVHPGQKKSRLVLSFLLSPFISNIIFLKVT